MSVLSSFQGPTQVFLFQPHPLAVVGLQATLKGVGRVSVITRGDLLARVSVAQLGSSVFILDKASHGDALAGDFGWLRSLLPGCRALLLDCSSDPEEQFQSLSLGFKGVVPYEQVSENLCPAILSVLSGGYWVDSDVLGEFVQTRSQRAASREGRDALTQREVEVTRLLRRRLSNKEISASLCVSEGTVKFHMANIFSKLGVRDRWSAVERLSGAGVGRHPT